jgi:hypothetical protein
MFAGPQIARNVRTFSVAGNSCAHSLRATDAKSTLAFVSLALTLLIKSSAATEERA